MNVIFADVHEKYLECFFDDTTRKLNTDLGTSSTNTPTECLRRCHDAGYKYSGVQVHT